MGLKKSAVGIARRISRRLGFDIVWFYKGNSGFPPDFSDTHKSIIPAVRPYTMTSEQRLHSLIESVRYVVSNSIDGAFVECGVYKGGSMMTVALTLKQLGIVDRDLYLFDTFEGMPRPQEDVDVGFDGTTAMDHFLKSRNSDTSSSWAFADLDSVRAAMRSTGYPEERIHFIKGMVEDTVPSKAPKSIALLRLDTDWYQSTIHEMEQLYPRISESGILIIDDYGHYKGARKAVDEYFSKHQFQPLLHRIDYASRLVVKH